MDDNQLLRYSRHILLDELGIEAQNRWLGSHVLILGAGGLGCAAAMYLACAGVGTLTLVDDDTVDVSNLQRQIGHTCARVGHSKVHSLRQTLLELNPDIEVHAIAQRAGLDNLDAWVRHADVAVDCSDNFATRQALNLVCVRQSTPLVCAAASGWQAQLSVFVPSSAASATEHSGPCYACMYSPQSEIPEAPCATTGIFAPVVGMVGSMQAAETLKLLAHAGTVAAGRLLMLNALTMEWTTLHVPRDPGCSVCGPHRLALS